MEINLKKLEELRDVRSRQEELKRIEADLARPVMTDVSEIGGIYERFQRLTDGMDQWNRYSKRRMFIFIVVWLYSPASIVSERLVPGVRSELTKVLQLKSRTIVSNEMHNLLFVYSTYSQFRADTNRVFRQLMEEMGLDAPGTGDEK